MNENHEQSKKHIAGYENKTILIVEDEETYRKFTTKVIEKYLMCNVSSCSNPKEAFEYLNHTIPDLIIMDLQMPFMDGLTAMKYIRASDRTTNVPVIICSALGFESIIKTMNQYRVSDFIVKPIEPQTLIKKILNSLNEPSKSIGSS